MKKGVKGYKVFDPDWTCRGFQYEVGKIFEKDVTPRICENGFHFCERAADCFNYYSFDSRNKVAEIIALGKVDSNGNKSCTNKIQIVREISWQELLTIVNIGKYCTGYKNTGNRNIGQYNTGECNRGDHNSGDKNVGDWNTGDSNIGSSNTGNNNYGSRNTGNWNTGNRNTGDWNKSSFSNGCFMTEEPTIMLFNKPSDWTYRDWLSSEARYLLTHIPDITEWVFSKDMTDEEKKIYAIHKTTGGYLKILDRFKSRQIWWDNLPKEHKDIIKSLPNFDAVIFEECTGIKVNEGKWRTKDAG